MKVQAQRYAETLPPHPAAADFSPAGRGTVRHSPDSWVAFSAMHVRSSHCSNLVPNLRKSPDAPETEAFLRANGSDVFRLYGDDRYMHLIAGGMVDKRRHRPSAGAVALSGVRGEPRNRLQDVSGTRLNAVTTAK